MDVPSDILSKLERYCAFQERCEAEVRQKLFSMPISVAQRDEIVRRLKDADFLNEERFVDVFIRSKMRSNHWGKGKIKQALFVKGVCGDLVDSKLNEIDSDEYAQLLHEVIEKWKKQNPADSDNRAKLIRSLISKGFEMGEIMNAVK